MDTTLSDKTPDGSYVDWPAIFAGTVVAVAIGLLLTSFGAALGLASITLDGTDDSSTLELVLTALWLVITLVASYLAGGYIAGRMRRRVESATEDEVTARDGINGLVVWGLGSVITAVMLSTAFTFAANTAGNVAAGAGKAAGTVVEAAGSAVGGAAAGLADAAGAAIPDEAKNDPTDYLSNQLLRPNQVNPTTADPEELAQQTASIMANVYRTGEVSEEDRTYLAGAVAARTDLTQAQAKTRVDTVVTEAQDARQEAEEAIAAAKAEAEQAAEEAKEAAIDAAQAARNAAILTAFVLAAASLIAGVASVAGSVHGGRHRDQGRLFAGLTYRG
ncbi:hypothetical protein LCGC14_0258050 [marine sediment metagenome]|uniref:PhnA-like protein n=2 Tax=root TaxID=1 RepID=A0A7V1F0N8_9RHOB|nr:hypothetical protein [Sulfitobacter litoralis]HDY95443.1 hypothetical protein [Sulfitobacter litoralis]HDZ53987.1 hypothetical protein [Sulfitobacter litoralis]